MTIVTLIQKITSGFNHELVITWVFSVHSVRCQQIYITAFGGIKRMIIDTFIAFSVDHQSISAYGTSKQTFFTTHI